jgi:hypothetical protein
MFSAFPNGTENGINCENLKHNYLTQVKPSISDVSGVQQNTLA